MKKTFSTSKTKNELLDILWGFEQMGSGLWKGNPIFPVSVQNGTYLYTEDSKKLNSKWILDIDKPNEISVQRKLFINDYVLIVATLLPLIIIAFLLFSNGCTFAELSFFAILLTVEALIAVGFSICLPYYYIRKFIEQQLGGTVQNKRERSK